MTQQTPYLGVWRTGP